MTKQLNGNGHGMATKIIYYSWPLVRSSTFAVGADVASIVLDSLLIFNQNASALKNVLI